MTLYFDSLFMEFPLFPASPSFIFLIFMIFASFCFSSRKKESV